MPDISDVRGEQVQAEDEGFTLVELLLVTVIIGILAAIAIPTMLILRVKAQNAAAATDLRSAAHAEESLLAEPSVTTYTTALSELEDQGLRRSPNVQMVGGVNGSTAFCLAASGTTREEWRIFDSHGGGMRTTLYPTASAAMASCSDPTIAGGGFVSIY